MRKRLLVIFAVFSALSLMSVAAFAQQQEPPDTTTPDDGIGVDDGIGTGQQGDYAVVRLEEQGGSGFHGIAVLREDANGNDVGNGIGEQPDATQPGQDGIGQQNGVGQVGAGQTEVVIALVGGGGGFLGLFGGDAESLGNAAVLSGTCEEPGAIVEDLGMLQALHTQQQQNGVGQQDGVGQQQDQQQQQQDLLELHVLSTTVNMGLDELLTGQYVLGVMERENDTAEPGEPGATPADPGATPTEPFAPGGQGQQQNGIGQQQEDINLVACGVLSAEARVQPALPMPGEPVDPIAPTPTPVEPMEPAEPTPAPAF